MTVMSLKLYYHPLSSFCWKVLIALYENDTKFEPVLVDLSNGAERAAFLKLWPIGKFPVLQDETREWMVPESSIIVEYLAQHYPGRIRLVPDDADLARQVRMRDRFFDLNLQVPMQKITGDRRRPAGQKDPFGVEQAGLRNGRKRNGLEAMGDGRRLHHGRLRRRTGTVLCELGDAARERVQKRRGLSATPVAAAVFRPRVEGS